MRITGGIWRSRAIKAPKGMTTRPTSDRVREALFSMLAADGVIGGSSEPRVLDLYAGSGALAFEALSRGASRAVLVEHGRDAQAAIRENTRALGAGDRVELVTTKVERALAQLQGPFDLIFADPPYADVRTPPFAAILEGIARILAPEGMFVLEHSSNDEQPTIAALEFDRSREYGDTTLSLYRCS